MARAADALMVNTGGARCAEDALQPRTKWRWPSKMYMDGPGIITLTMDIIPRLVQQVLANAQLAESDVDMFLMHQATLKLLDTLRQHMQMDEQNDADGAARLRQHGLFDDSDPDQRSACFSGRLRPGTRSLLAGFGVGFSWAGCVWTETWENKAVAVNDAEPRSGLMAALRPAFERLKSPPLANLRESLSSANRRNRHIFRQMDWRSVTSNLHPDAEFAG